MKKTNFFINMVCIAIVMILSCKNAWANSWSDRGYIKTNTEHKNLKLLDSQSISISKYITGTTFTFENWVYFDGTLANMFFHNNGAQFGFQASPARIIMQNLGTAQRTVNVFLDYTVLPEFSDLTVGRWIHIALVVDGNNWKIYIDGTVRYNKDLGGGYINNTEPFYIAGNPWNPFSGKVADVRVWNIARTGADILENMRKILPIETPNLISRINFGEGGTVNNFQNYASVGGGAWVTGTLPSTASWGLVSTTPTNIQVTEITSNGFTLNWDGGSETEYEVAVRQKNTTTEWTIFTATSKSKVISGLPYSTYDVKIRSKMPLETDYSDIIEVLLLDTTTSKVNNQQAAGFKLHTSDLYWQIENQNAIINALVYNLSGELLGEYCNQKQVRIDKSDFCKGVYIIKVYAQEEKSVFKVMK